MMSISVDSIATFRAFPAETRDVASAAYCPVEREQIILIVLAIFYIMRHLLGVVILVNHRYLTLCFSHA